MGFDIMGKNPKNAKGEYFRNNVWWWRPLWDYVAESCKDVLSESDLRKGGYNDGHLIHNDKAKRIAIRLEHLVRQGEVKRYEKEYKQQMKEIPDEKCDLCHGTGTRKDKHTNYQNMKCNKCEGKGDVRPFETNYPFSEANVKEFIEFCRNSGGFEIW